MINTSRLEIKEYSNYKEVCSALGEEKMDGNSKKKQMAEWSRYFDWERVPSSNKILIREIYRFPKLKEKKKRTVSLSDFNSKISDLLTIYLFENGNPIVQKDKEYLMAKMFKYELYCYCGFGQVSLKPLMDEVSKEKEEKMRSDLVFAPAGNIKELFVKTFYESAGSKLKNALKQIAKQGKIEIIRDFVCYTEDWYKIPMSGKLIEEFEEKRQEITKILNLTELEIYENKKKAETYTKMVKLMLKYFFRNTKNFLEITTIKAPKEEVYKEIERIQEGTDLKDVKKQLRYEVNEIITAKLIESILKTDTKFNKKELFIAEQENIEYIMDDEVNPLWAQLKPYIEECIVLDKSKFKQIFENIKNNYFKQKAEKDKEERRKKAEARERNKRLADDLAKDLEELEKVQKTNQ